LFDWIPRSSRGMTVSGGGIAVFMGGMTGVFSEMVSIPVIPRLDPMRRIGGIQRKFAGMM